MKRFQKTYEAKKKAENDNLPLIHSFLNKRVRVKVHDGLTVEGVLVRYQNEDKVRHFPNVLILKDGSNYHILRGNFENITEADKHEHE
jgi:small nuclear ribonucleoprotein (snRNP)-like protein